MRKDDREMRKGEGVAEELEREEQEMGVRVRIDAIDVSRKWLPCTGGTLRVSSLHYSSIV